jgi:hypothetical protein
LVVEAEEAVPWTKPADLRYAADQPLPSLGGLSARDFRPFSEDYWRLRDRFRGVFFDGHVGTMSTRDEVMLRAMITDKGKREGIATAHQR